MQQPSITFWGFILHEPATVLTDLILSVACLIFFYKVRKIHATYWSVFFVLMSLATFLGAMGHGLFTDKNNYVQWFSRLIGIVSIYFASIASIHLLDSIRLKKFLFGFALAELIMALVLILLFNNFRVVKFNGTLGMGFLVGGIHLSRAFSGRRGSAMIVGGILINALAGLVHRYQISPDKWFNYNDLGHVIMLSGLYVISRGVIQNMHEENV